MAGADLESLVARAGRLAGRGGRRILGITGSPGAGKSTLAAQVVAALGSTAVLLPMDGFHLAQQQLLALDLVATKGAIDTFDVDGFVHLLSRVRRADALVYAPDFRRDWEEPVAAAIAVAPDVPLVVVEGNYLLVDSGGWERVRPMLDEVWFLDPAEDVRMARLLARHMQFGRDRAEADDRARGSDQINAELIAATRRRADLIVTGL